MALNPENAVGLSWFSTSPTKPLQAVAISAASAQPRLCQKSLATVETFLSLRPHNPSSRGDLTTQRVRLAHCSAGQLFAWWEEQVKRVHEPHYRPWSVVTAIIASLGCGICEIGQFGGCDLAAIVYHQNNPPTMQGLRPGWEWALKEVIPRP